MKTKLLLWVFMLAILSCSEELVIKPYEYTSIFTGEHSKTWKIKFIEVAVDGEVVDTFTEPCAADDTFTFNNDFERSFEVRTGNNKCFSDPDESDIISDNWSFSNATATLTMVLPLPYLTDSSLPYIVREATDDDMELEIFFSDNVSLRIHFDAIDED